MIDFFTTRQVQDLLKVDRITIYRMLQDGRLKGVKIGQQWRFARAEVERLLNQGLSTSTEMENEAADTSFPTHCVQAIQDLFAGVSQMNALVVDMSGTPLTDMSSPCALCRKLMSTSSGMEACMQSWRGFAMSPAQDRRYTCHAGLNYVGAPVMDAGEQIGMFLAGPFYWQTPDSADEAQRMARLAEMHHLNVDELMGLAREIRVMGRDLHAQLEAWPAAATRAVQSILHERTGFIHRLKRIADLTQIS